VPAPLHDINDLNQQAQVAAEVGTVSVPASGSRNASPDLQDATLEDLRTCSGLALPAT
jgi:hypothetical protein